MSEGVNSSRPVHINKEYRAARGLYGPKNSPAIMLTLWGQDRGTLRWSHLQDVGIRDVNYSERMIGDKPVVYQGQ